MKYFILTIISLFTINTVVAQDYDFGKVSKAELTEKFHPKDSSAVAAVLYKNEEISFIYINNEGFMQERKVHERIKIYTKDGFDWATKKVYLYQGDSDTKEKFSHLKGFTYNIENGKVEKEKLSNDGKFSEDHSEYMKINSFTMPNVKEGSVIEYRYTITTPRASMDDVVLQYDIPINKLDVRIGTPEYYVYSKQLNPRARFIPKINTSSKNQTIPFSYKTDIVEFNEVDIPGLKEEAFSGNINNFRCIFKLELSALLDNNKLLRKSFSQSWEEVSKTIYDSPDFGGQISKTNFYKDDLEVLLANVNDDLEKAKLVESFVKSKVKWNGRYGKYTQNGIRSAFKEGEGNDADINLLVVAMLRSQGVDANPILISTRDNGIPLFPTLNGFNYVICSVQSGERVLLIDATEKFSTDNILPFRALNWQGRLVKEDGTSSWVNILPSHKSMESTMLNIQMDEDFVARGKVAKNLTSYSAYSYRDRYSGITTEEHIKRLEEDKGGIEISNLDYKNGKDITKPVKISYEYELTDGIDELGDKLYFSPLLFLKTKENPFKLEERQYPIDFIVPFEDRFLVNIMIPEGYKVESMPQTEALEFNNSDAKFVYLIQENGNFLQLKIEFQLNNPLVLPSDYKVFKDFYAKMVEKQAEQIVLSKV